LSASTNPSDDPADENRDALFEFLNDQRDHAVGILEDLSEEQLHRAVLPSGWSPLGMVRHLAIDVEHYWFRCIIGGEPLGWFAENGYGDSASWKVGETELAADGLALYRREIEKANEVIAATPLGMAPRQRDEWWGDWEVPDFRFVMLHVIAETACHAGHLDAARELIDGRQWMPL
jgi:hypothetical protein